MRRAAIEFCRKTGVWSAVLAEVDLDSSDFPYSPTPDTDAAIHKIVSVIMDGESPGLEEVSVRAMDIDFNDWRTETGVPANFINTPKGTATVIPLPDAARGFVFTVIYEPAADATTLPDALVNDWLDEIVSGASAKLSALPKKPWTDFEMANYHNGLFKDGIEAAKVDCNRNFVLPALVTLVPPI